MRSTLLASINLAAMFLGCSFLAHTIAQLHWRRRGTSSVMLLIGLCGQIWMVPQAINFFGFKSTELLYSLWFGNWIVLGFAVMLLCLTIRGSSRDLSDAALLDGAGRFTAFRHVVWPTIKSALIALAFLLVMATWTEFASPLVGIEIIGALGADKFPALVLGSFVATLPVLAIFVWAQHSFLQLGR